jgi:hypothetical protein
LDGRSTLTPALGRLSLIARLVVKDLRHRSAQALLLLLAIAAGTATLTLGLSLRGTTDNPYARTMAATNGPDVVATVFTGGSNVPGVVAHSGPFPVTWTMLYKGQTTDSAEVEGRSSAPSSVDQPKLLKGSWVRPGGIVVEAGFASALGPT